MKSFKKICIFQKTILEISDYLKKNNLVEM